MTRNNADFHASQSHHVTGTHENQHYSSSQSDVVFLLENNCNTYHDIFTIFTGLDFPKLGYFSLLNRYWYRSKMLIEKNHCNFLSIVSSFSRQAYICSIAEQVSRVLPYQKQKRKKIIQVYCNIIVLCMTVTC